VAIVLTRNWLFFIVRFTLIVMITINIGLDLYYIISSYISSQEVENELNKLAFTGNNTTDNNVIYGQFKGLISSINLLLLGWVTSHLFLYVIGFVGINTESFNLTMCFTTAIAMLAIIKFIGFTYITSKLNPYYPIVSAMSALLSALYTYFVVNVEDTPPLPVARRGNRVS